MGIAHHLGWAVAVTASADHAVVDRRRIELIEPGLPAAPIHHEGGPHLMHRSAEPLDDEALAADAPLLFLEHEKSNPHCNVRRAACSPSTVSAEAECNHQLFPRSAALGGTSLNSNS